MKRSLGGFSESSERACGGCHFHGFRFFFCPSSVSFFFSDFLWDQGQGSSSKASSDGDVAWLDARIAKRFSPRWPKEARKLKGRHVAVGVKTVLGSHFGWKVRIHHPRLGGIWVGIGMFTVRAVDPWPCIDRGRTRDTSPSPRFRKHKETT